MFNFSTISEYHQQLADGSATCEEAVLFYIDKINQQANLNAFTATYAAEALAQAKKIDNERASGKPVKRLHGVVLAIKDVICYAGHPVTAASNILKGFISQYTASALQFLLDEDAIVIGTCNCDEFAMGSTNENSAYGKVLNALDNTRVPGGSSGGSAVAVQADMCMVSLGSDTGGSVRQPADLCGLVGLKPGYGSISRYGLLAYASSFDQIGIFGNSTDDVALLYEIMHQQDKMDSTMDVIADEKITVPETGGFKKFCLFHQVMKHPSIDAEIAAGINAQAEKLRAQGHTVDFVDFDLLDYIVPAYYVLTTAEASSNLSRYDGVRYGHRSAVPAGDIDTFYKQNRSEGFGLEVKRRILLGTFVLSTGFYDAYYSKAQQIRQLLVNKVEEVFAEYDALLMPTVPGTAMKLGADAQDPLATYLADIFTVFANLTGIPAISLPLFSHSNNMPFGLQILVNKGNELPLLRFSKQLLKANVG